MSQIRVGLPCSIPAIARNFPIAGQGCRNIAPLYRSIAPISLAWCGIAMLVIGIVYHVYFMIGLRKEREAMAALSLITPRAHFHRR
jgi:hypothetical protein